MRVSIRYQLLLPLLALMLGVVGMSTWTAWSSGQRARRQIEAQMDAIAATVDAVSFPRNTQTLNLMKGLSGADFALCDERQEPLLDDADRPITTLAALLPPLPPLAMGETTVQAGGTRYLCRGVPLHHGTPGTLLYLLYPESRWQDAVWQALRPALTLGIVGSLASIALMVVVTQRLTRRIQGLERRTRLIAAGDFSPMPLPHRHDELRDLSQSVNEMAQRLADYRETTRRTDRLRLLGQVSGGLAHQLRNGVTGARLAIQLHRRETRGTSDALDVALRQLALVEMHLKRFLDLGKSIDLQCRPCELGALVGEAVTLVGPQCLHAGIALRWQASSESYPVQVDPEQLGQVLLNVLTNAVEAAGPSGRVEATLHRLSASDEVPRVELAICDSGPGPAPDVAERLFEPFVTGKPEGVGLGLAVARQITEAHGGRITWQHDAGGTCFRITLPVREPDTLPSVP